MIRIEDMSEPQRQSWMSFMADGAVFLWFLSQMFDLRGFLRAPFEQSYVVDLPAGELMALFVVTIGWTIAAHIVIAVIFEARKRKSKNEVERDERDAAIERYGDRFGYYALCVFVNVIIFVALAQNIGGEGYRGPIDVASVSGLFFWLMCGAYVADIGKQAVRIIRYQGWFGTGNAAW